MKIKKVNDTFNTYSVELSWGQLISIRNALAADHADPVSDELHAELNWYLDNVPGPGESEEDLDKAKEAEASGMASPEAAQQPPDRADELLPAPEDEYEEGGGIGGEEGGEFEPEPEPEGGEPEGGEEASELDRRLPPPPEE